MNNDDVFHLNSFQDSQMNLPVINPFAGLSVRRKKQVANEVITYWWHQTGYVLCPEED